MSHTEPTTFSMPLSLMRPLCKLARHPVVVQYLCEDQYAFATYMCAVGSVLTEERIVERSKQLREVATMIGPVQESLKKQVNDDEKTRHRAMQMLSELRGHLGNQVTQEYASRFLTWIGIFDAKSSKTGLRLSKSTIESLVSLVAEGVLELADRYPTNVDDNLNRLEELFELTAEERRLIETCMLFTADLASALFMGYLERSINKRADMMQELALTMIASAEAYNGLPGDDTKTHHESLRSARRALKVETSKPLAFGIARFDPHFKRFGRVSEFWINAICSQVTIDGDKDELNFIDRFVRVAKPKTSYSGALARISDKDESILVEALNAVTGVNTDARWESKGKEFYKGFNVLFYGSRKLDKRNVVLKQLEKHGYTKVYELPLNELSFEDYPSVAWAAQRILSQRMKTEHDQQVVLLVDKANDVLTKGYRKSQMFFSMFGDGASKNKEQVVLDSDQILLTESIVPSVWMANDVADIDDEAVGRFLLHIEVRGGSRADRRDEVKRVVSELKLNDDVAHNLAKYYELGSHQIRSAARLIELLDKKDPEASQLIINTVENSQKALGRESQEEIRETVTKYDLDLLNLSGHYSPTKIIESLRKRPNATICLYGLPGTGKTALAEYMARELDLPILIKRASDILSMWLGENEQNIKKMFQEAREEGALLLLDEADSFLRDRALARASWDVTMVNELLTQMERFNGIFICATNLFEALDAAALRRFTFKLQFHQLSEEQRIRMFRNETGVDLTDADTDPRWADLMSMRYLTPGDFAVVKRQANLFGEDLTPEAWLAQLREESNAKLIGLARNNMLLEGDREVTNKSKQID